MSSQSSSRKPASASSAGVGLYASRHFMHSFRASRWATTQSMALATRYGSTPISISRGSAEGASFVWSVDSTRWPVRAASMAIRAVSRSRISPTRTMSGSARRIDRSAEANVSPARGLICIWLMPGSRYSTGSSTVMMFRSGLLRMFRVAYSVVDLPEPVGPVTRMAPYGLVNADS